MSIPPISSAISPVAAHSTLARARSGAPRERRVRFDLPDTTASVASVYTRSMAAPTTPRHTVASSCPQWVAAPSPVQEVSRSQPSPAGSPSAPRWSQVVEALERAARVSPGHADSFRCDADAETFSFAGMTMGLASFQERSSAGGLAGLQRFRASDLLLERISCLMPGVEPNTQQFLVKAARALAAGAPHLLEADRVEDPDGQERLDQLRGMDSAQRRVETLRKRPIPPVSAYDTIIAQGVSAHPESNCFEDHEILEIVVARQALMLKMRARGNDQDASIPALLTDEGRLLIQQQGTRACTAACEAMLILDNGGRVDLEGLAERNLGTHARTLKEILAGGQVPVCASITGGRDDAWGALQQAVDRNGSGILEISDPKTGGHVIILDQILEDRARIREPYHGWDMWVTREALLKRLGMQAGLVYQAHTLLTQIHREGSSQTESTGGELAQRSCPGRVSATSDTEGPAQSPVIAPQSPEVRVAPPVARASGRLSSLFSLFQSFWTWLVSWFST